MRVREQEVFVHDIIFTNTDVAWQFCQDPDLFTFSQNSCSLEHGFIRSYQGIEKAERILVLDRFIAGPNYSKNLRCIRSHRCERVRDDLVLAPDNRLNRLELHGKIQSRGLNGFLCRSGSLKLCSKLMPRNFANIKHAGLP